MIMMCIVHERHRASYSKHSSKAPLALLFSRRIPEWRFDHCVAIAKTLAMLRHGPRWRTSHFPASLLIHLSRQPLLLLFRDFCQSFDLGVLEREECDQRRSKHLQYLVCIVHVLSDDTVRGAKCSNLHFA